ncbi:MAG TPA: DUF4412 domain-containing protein [Gemmatimonadales bacterium]|nr:DUF4412 domain-containing protein [Gemmatimonadales bacterium]
MRRLLPLLLLTAAPLAAQTWQGSVTMTMTSPEMGRDPVTIVMHRRGAKLANVMTMTSGPMAGQEVRMLIDDGGTQMTMLTPLPEGVMIPPAMTGGKPAKGMKMVMDIGGDVAEASAETGTVKALGTSQTIAGTKCDDYEVATRGETMQMCLAAGLGKFTFVSAAPGGRGAAKVPDWARALEGKFPLQVRDKAGKFSMTATKITPGAPAASLFEVPEGYADMSAMMGGMGRRPRN